MDFRANEKKWQEHWEKTRLYSFDTERRDEKLYVLEMFSYPSAAKLHVGHWYNYGPSDTYARFKRMQGYEVFHPMGFDSFGLPAENYAIKTGIHPQDSTYANMDIMEEQLKNIGASFDWDYTLRTSDPSYYHWTQWIFLQLYKNGLAYRKEAPVNWCPSCNTVLANEQVVDGECERCGTLVTRKNLTQWFFKITDYAEELLSGLDDLDWPEKTKLMQRNWIGKSSGAQLTFAVDGADLTFDVFTTRPDTLFGNTYCVLAPEHPLVDAVTTSDQQDAVDAYRQKAAEASDIDRLSTTREKTGVFTGSYAINPINGEKVPIWIADYVLFSYGTGAVMAVPGHDERDYEFASAFGLPIVRVIKGKDGEDDLPYTGPGVMVNSGKYDGVDAEQGKAQIVAELHTKDLGEEKINYRMRDWLISRQRYWGAPIPIIHCPKCGIVPVPEQDLPVLLPYDADFTPDGTSPLLKHEGFLNVTCPVCGEDAKRDADTMDTFVCSSWYYLRYPDNRNDAAAFDPAIINQMLPVDVYVGGVEHAVLHLLYARFFTKALRDMGFINFDEPFRRLVHQGLILGADGEKMSKSRGNVVSPDDFIDVYGTDVFRMYLEFGFNYIEGGPWNDDGIKAIARFLERIERLINRQVEIRESGETRRVIRKYYGIESRDGLSKQDKELLYTLHYTIKHVTEDIENFSFNTAIARIMELVNAMYRYQTVSEDDAAPELLFEVSDNLALLLAPIVPHFAEEIHKRLGNSGSVFKREWPQYDETALQKDVDNIGVQINGKLRTRIDVEADVPDEEIEAIALADEKVIAALEDKKVRRVIVIGRRLVNIVVE
ncbi:leucine--tRNA ligase [Eubacteriales bacterium OttesenSCG-928-N14]|nr:leucine--tRNA ligase [Eubacteriales bacterium OttesenSCG-928-N14]